MQHECSLCLKDNKRCVSGKTFFELLFSKVKDCYLYTDYKKGLEKQKRIKTLKEKKQNVAI